MPSIEEARGLLGEHIALLHDYAGGDPGWKNLLDDNVRGAADGYALAVLKKASGLPYNGASDFDHQWAELRANIKRLGR